MFVMDKKMAWKHVTQVAQKCVDEILPLVTILKKNKIVKINSKKSSPYQKYPLDVLRKRIGQEHTACERLEDKAGSFASLMAGANLVSGAVTLAMSNGTYSVGIQVAGLVAAVNIFLAWWLAMHSATAIKIRYGIGTAFEASEDSDGIARALWQQEQQNRLLVNLNCGAQSHFRNGVAIAWLAFAWYYVEAL